MGDIQCLKEEHDAGINNYGKAITIDSKFAPAYRKRGYCYFLKRQYEAAIADYDKAIQFDAKDAAAYFGRGLATRYLNEKSLNSRILCTIFNDVSKAIELDPRWGHAHRFRASLFEHFIDGVRVGNEISCLANFSSGGDFARAGIKDAEKAIELDPQDDSAYYTKGRLHFYLEEYNVALRDLNKALELDPQTAEAYCVRAQLHGAMGNAAKKEQDLQKYSSFKLGDCPAFHGKQTESSSRQQLPPSNRKGACGCYACGLLLAVDFPNKSKDCFGILATDACPQELAQMPDKGIAYCQEVKRRSKDRSFVGCTALANYCSSLGQE